MTQGYNAKQVRELAEQILHHKQLYYAGQPEISDAAFDKLEDQLRRLAPNHPVLSMIGAEPESTARKVVHDVPILSLQKTYDRKDLLAWIKDEPIVGTLKVDGNSLSLVYEMGEMRCAKTRGNGRIGEEVSDKAVWVADIPPKLPVQGKIEVRGELYCVESQFLRLAENMAKLGFEKPTSPRNIVAGLLGRKTHFSLMRYFNFFAFDVVDYDGILHFRTEEAKFAWLKEVGFALPFPKLINTPDDLDQYLDFVKQTMAEDEIGLDGAVFSYNQISLHEELGNTSHHPRFKMSFKWQGQTAQSIIKEVSWATSRLGIVTPVAVIEPVVLSGAQITNVTLHNAAHVKSYNIKAGDLIEIVRSGEVIPKFLEVIKPAAGHCVLPTACPTCGAALQDDDVRLKCPNTSGCPAQQIGMILNWIRSAEIDDLSEKRLMPLIEAGKVKTMADLYHLSLEDFYIIPQTKEKMATKLHQNIQKSRSLPLARFLNGLGIEGAGITTWEKLLDSFPSLQLLQQASAESIMDLEGFAEKSAWQIVTGLKEKEPYIKQLLAAGVVPEAPPAEEEDGDEASKPLLGKTLVITGALSVPRVQVEKLIKAAGGKVASSVSKHTFAVVTDDPKADSSKMKKARELGVATWNEEDLWQKLGKKP